MSVTEGFHFFYTKEKTEAPEAGAEPWELFLGPAPAPGPAAPHMLCCSPAPPPGLPEKGHEGEI